jgi:hypothetical protein
MFLGAAAAVVVVVLAVAPSALAGDPDYLQDLCVADLNSGKLPSRPASICPAAPCRARHRHFFA